MGAVLTLQHNVLSKNGAARHALRSAVLTLQHNVLSKNIEKLRELGILVLTLQHNVLSKNQSSRAISEPWGFDFTT